MNLYAAQVTASQRTGERPWFLGLLLLEAKSGAGRAPRTRDTRRGGRGGSLLILKSVLFRPHTEQGPAGPGAPSASLPER